MAVIATHELGLVRPRCGSRARRSSAHAAHRRGLFRRALQTRATRTIRRASRRCRGRPDGRSMPGYWNLHRLGRPEARMACTCPTDAAATGIGSQSRKKRRDRRRARPHDFLSRARRWGWRHIGLEGGQPPCASGGKPLGNEADSWPAFMIAPFMLPSHGRRPPPCGSRTVARAPPEPRRRLSLAAPSPRRSGPAPRGEPPDAGRPPHPISAIGVEGATEAATPAATSPVASEVAASFRANADAGPQPAS